jgi:hypothetical protein
VKDDNRKPVTASALTAHLRASESEHGLPRVPRF